METTEVYYCFSKVILELNILSPGGGGGFKKAYFSH